MCGQHDGDGGEDRGGGQRGHHCLLLLPYEVPTAVHTALTSDTQGKITTYTTG
jgi:hypothetical protein